MASREVWVSNGAYQGPGLGPFSGVQFLLSFQLWWSKEDKLRWWSCDYSLVIFILLSFWRLVFDSFPVYSLRLNHIVDVVAQYRFLFLVRRSEEFESLHWIANPCGDSDTFDWSDWTACRYLLSWIEAGVGCPLKHGVFLGFSGLMIWRWLHWRWSDWYWSDWRWSGSLEVVLYVGLIDMSWLVSVGYTSGSL